MWSSLTKEAFKKIVQGIHVPAKKDDPSEKGSVRTQSPTAKGEKLTTKGTEEEKKKESKKGCC